MSPVVTTIIGLSSYREEAAWGAWRQTSDLLPAGYADAIRAAGGVPMLLPPGADDPVAAALASVSALDGLVLTGGADVDPARYGQARQDGTDAPRSDRDAWEIALVHAAMAADRPILAVCRGLQLLNVALGGTLVQDLPSTLGNHAHRGEIGSFIAHPVSLAPGSELARIYGVVTDVHTHHHQAVDRLADRLTAIAWAEDGIVEAAECRGAAWITGVQWHPEVGGGNGLFAAFVRACQSPPAGRS